MRTTIEVPDDLMIQAKSLAALAGVTLREYFIEALQEKMAPPARKIRRPPPEIGSPDSPPIGVLTPDQIDEAMFG